MKPRSGLGYPDQTARVLKNKHPEGRPGAGSGWVLWIH
jgi:hypothetical protein